MLGGRGCLSAACLPSAANQRVGPHFVAAVMLLLSPAHTACHLSGPAPCQGSLVAPSATDPVLAPGVLPWLPTLAASWYASARAIGPPPAQPVRLQAGPEGAMMLVCGGTQGPGAALAAS